MYAIGFDKKVEKIIVKWKKSNPVLFKKLNNILKDMMLHPRNGLGHPEPMIGGADMVYSRHISAHDRIIYRIFDNEIYILVIELEGHYSDK